MSVETRSPPPPPAAPPADPQPRVQLRRPAEASAPAGPTDGWWTAAVAGAAGAADVLAALGARATAELESLPDRPAGHDWWYLRALAADVVRFLRWTDLPVPSGGVSVALALVRRSPRQPAGLRHVDDPAAAGGGTYLWPVWPRVGWDGGCATTEVYTEEGKAEPAPAPAEPGAPLFVAAGVYHRTPSCLDQAEPVWLLTLQWRPSVAGDGAAGDSWLPLGAPSTGAT